METKNNMLKQALTRREACALPSNFTYRMMKEVRLAAERKRKRQALFTWISLIAAVLFFIALAVYFIVFYLGFNIKEYIPTFEFVRPSVEMVGFYWYVGFLALVLLGLDYRMRIHKRKAENK